MPDKFAIIARLSVVTIIPAESERGHGFSFYKIQFAVAKFHEYFFNHLQNI
jgi:hypothetical protein